MFLARPQLGRIGQGQLFLAPAGHKSQSARPLRHEWRAGVAGRLVCLLAGLLGRAGGRRRSAVDCRPTAGGRRLRLSAWACCAPADRRIWRSVCGLAIFGSSSGALAK